MSYSAVVLDEQSQNKLKDWALSDKAGIKINGVRLAILVRDNGWKMFCHHMTIQFPGIPEYLKPYVDSVQNLEAISLGISDKAIAIRVIGFHSENAIPHITVAVGNGGKPVDSNKIKSWMKIPSPLKLSGIVTEVK
jgi:hypothetical protein